jgi:IclR family acetate operon transcriptional repressor
MRTEGVMTARSTNPYSVQPVAKALAVLAYVAESGRDVTLTNVSIALRIPKTTTFRYLQTLVESGFLRHDPATDRYAMGPRFLTIAKADIDISSLRRLAGPAMTGLMNEFNETVNLGISREQMIVYIDLVVANRALRMQIRIGETHPMHSTALGKAILAHLPDEALTRYLAQPLVLRTGRTVIERSSLDVQLRQVRRAGYAIETGENEDGAMCIGAPVFDETGYPIAALSISAPITRMPRKLATKAGSRLLEVTRDLSAALSHKFYSEFR